MPNLILPIDVPEDQQGALVAEICEALSLVSVPATFGVPEWEAPPAEPDPNWFKLPSANSQRQSVLLLILEGGKTRDELCHALDRENSSIDARVLELIGGGWIIESDEQRQTRYGRKATVLEATDKARSNCRLAPLKWFPGGVRPETCR